MRSSFNPSSTGPRISLISCKARSKVPSAAARNKFSRARHFKASTYKKQNFTKLCLWELLHHILDPLAEDDVEDPILNLLETHMSRTRIRKLAAGLTPGFYRTLRLRVSVAQYGRKRKAIRGRCWALLTYQTWNGTGSSALTHNCWFGIWTHEATSCFMSYELSTKRSAKSPAYHNVSKFCHFAYPGKHVEDPNHRGHVSFLLRNQGNHRDWESNPKKSILKALENTPNIDTLWQRSRLKNLPSPDLQETIGTWSSVAPDTKKI